MELAICYWGLEEPQKTAERLLKNEVYLAEYGPEFFLKNEDDKIADTAKAFKEKGIRIRSIHAPFGGGCNLSNPDEVEREQAIQKTRQILYKAAAGDVEMIIIHPCAGGVADPEEQDKRSLLAYDSISQLMDAAEETGVAMALENMLPNHAGCEIRHIMDTVEKINSPMLGICLDSGHAHVCGNLAECVEAFGKKIISIHMQDNDGTRDMHLQPPYGTTDWPTFVKCLHKVGYQRPITIEAGPWGGSSYKHSLREVSAVLENPDKIYNRCPVCSHAILRSGKQWFCGCNDTQ